MRAIFGAWLLLVGTVGSAQTEPQFKQLACSSDVTPEAGLDPHAVKASVNGALTATGVVREPAIVPTVRRKSVLEGHGSRFWAIHDTLRENLSSRRESYLQACTSLTGAGSNYRDLRALCMAAGATEQQLAALRMNDLALSRDLANLQAQVMGAFDEWLPLHDAATTARDTHGIDSAAAIGAIAQCVEAGEKLHNLLGQALDMANDQLDTYDQTCNGLDTLHNNLLVNQEQ